MGASNSIYWYDLETFGIDPKRDRIAQFAGLRTDLDLNPISAPLVMYCKQANDMLPSPQSCLITGITPQMANEKGSIESDFITTINEEFLTANTCVAGYNSLRFDDEFVRYTLYRNLHDPYEREWKNGNSRWDIIDLVRATRALRPDGIEWPQHDTGLPSFRLEDLTIANNIAHENAHDALSDVHATIAIAKLIKDKQEKLYNFIFKLRNKNDVFSLIDVKQQTPVVHTSGMFSSEYYCTSVVMPIVSHPTNKNGIIVFDLRSNPEILMDLSVEEIRKRVFTSRDELPDGVERIPLKSILANKCPIVAPISTLDNASERRIQLERSTWEKNWRCIKDNSEIKNKVFQVFNHKGFTPSDDPDQQLYQGFFNGQDKATMRDIRNSKPEEINRSQLYFNDQRLDELVFRYSARNYPETLSESDKDAWEKFRHERICDESAGGSITIDSFNQILADISAKTETTEAEHKIIQALHSYASELLE